MLYLCNLASGRQQVVEMAFPQRRIFAGAISARLRPIENRLYASPYSRRGFRLGGPYRFEDLHDQRDVDRLHRQWSEDRTDIGPECGLPLRDVLADFSRRWLCDVMKASAH